jgi:hypothetical protein
VKDPVIIAYYGDIARWRGGQLSLNLALDHPVTGQPACPTATCYAPERTRDLADAASRNILEGAGGRTMSTSGDSQVQRGASTMQG